MDDDSKEQAGWAFHAEEDTIARAPAAVQPDVEPISWTGSEYVAEHKDTGWYFMLTGAVAVLCAVTYFLTKGDLLSVISIAIIGALFAIIASKEPRQLHFMIDNHGITVDNKIYPYDMFKSFSVIHDGAIGYISLFPLQRFKPELAIYYPPDHEQSIFDALGSFLPYEQRNPGHVDKLSKRIRF